MNYTAVLALEDGTLFRGRSIGINGETVGEVVFNTAMTGYQEILTDPSYCQQLVTLTQSHIGNVGCNTEDNESGSVFASGLIIRDLPLLYSSWRSTISLSDYLTNNNVVAIADIDTRRLTRILRDKGAQRGCIIAGNDLHDHVAVEKANAFPGLMGVDLAKQVSVRTAYSWQEGTWKLDEGFTHAQTHTGQYRVVAYDYGIKRNILRLLADAGCDLTVVPADTAVADVLAMQPDGVFLSNGPGDPAACHYAFEAIRELVSLRIPVFGICLGYQLLSLALGAKTLKMKFGHHGANHPVQDLKTSKVHITSQNHGFAVDEESLPAELEATHRSLFDHSLQGVHHRTLPAFGFQGHPEASPGPHDIHHLFDHFIELIKHNKSSNG